MVEYSNDRGKLEIQWHPDQAPRTSKRMVRKNRAGEAIMNR
jgi:hypothetical protein